MLELRTFLIYIISISSFSLSFLHSQTIINLKEFETLDDGILMPQLQILEQREIIDQQSTIIKR